MKKLFLMTVLLLLVTVSSFAQRYIPGQKAIQLTLGAVDGFKLKQQDGQAFSIGIAISKYTKGTNRWIYGGEFLQKYFGYKNIYIPLNQFTAEAGYYHKLLADPSKTFFFSIGGSLLAGYETINWGDKQLRDGASIENKDAFLFGASLGLETECFISDRYVLLLGIKERYLPTSSVSDFHFQLSLGIKIIIN